MEFETNVGKVSVLPPLMGHKRKYRAALREVWKKETEEEKNTAMLDLEDVAVEIAQSLCSEKFDDMIVDDVNTIVNAVVDTMNGVRNRDFTPASSKPST